MHPHGFVGCFRPARSVIGFLPFYEEACCRSLRTFEVLGAEMVRSSWRLQVLLQIILGKWTSSFISSNISKPLCNLFQKNLYSRLKTWKRLRWFQWKTCKSIYWGLPKLRVPWRLDPILIPENPVSLLYRREICERGFTIHFVPIFNHSCCFCWLMSLMFQVFRFRIDIIDTPCQGNHRKKKSLKWRHKKKIVSGSQQKPTTKKLRFKGGHRRHRTCFCILYKLTKGL